MIASLGIMSIWRFSGVVDGWVFEAEMLWDTELGCFPSVSSFDEPDF